MHTLQITAVLNELNKCQAEIFALVELPVDVRKELGEAISERLDVLLENIRDGKNPKAAELTASSAHPCDAIDAAVAAQQQVVDQLADQLLVEELALLILQMQQSICHSMNP